MIESPSAPPPAAPKPAAPKPAAQSPAPQPAAQSAPSKPAAPPAVVLIGPPGAGKSVVGALLAAGLGVEFRDTDAEIGAAAGKPVGDIFIDDGEEAFRALESAAAAAALGERGPLRERGGVLALGSGAVLDGEIQRLLDGLPVIYLAADFRTVARRTGLDVARVVVPGNPRGRLRAMLEERRPLYEQLASITVQTDDKDPEELAAEITAMIGPPR